MTQRKGIHALWLHQTHLSKKPVCLNRRISLSRNVAGIPFPLRASARQRSKFLDQLQHVLQQRPDFKEWCKIVWQDCCQSDQDLLKAIYNFRNPCDEMVMFFHEKTCLQLIVNDSDHLLLQLNASEGSLRRYYQQLCLLEENLESAFEYAFDPTYGYYTRSPEILGTGLQVKVLLHLPGLCFMQKLPILVRAVSEMNLCIKPEYFINDKVFGHLFCLSNAVSWGCSEETLCLHVEEIVERIVEEEVRVRQEMLTQHTSFLQDSIGRALGLLSNCYELSFEEAMNFLSIVIMAMDIGILPAQRRAPLLVLWYSMRREFLREFCKKSFDAVEESRVRAQLVKAFFQKTTKLLANKEIKEISHVA